MSQILKHDFGIIPHFSISCYFEHDPEGAMLDSADMTARLAEPISTAPLGTKPGPKYASYAVDSVVDHTAGIKSLSDDPMQRFKIAVNALRLEKPHTVIAREMPDWIEDTGSEEEDSDEYEEEITDCAVCGESIGSHEKSIRSEDLATKFDTASKDWPLLKGKSFDDPESSSNQSISREEEASSEVSSFGYDSQDGNMIYVPPFGDYCIECGEEDCAGAFAMTKPKLTMLGSGELGAYAVVDE